MNTLDEAVPASEPIDVRTVRWAHGWELHISGVGVTQCDTLSHAAAMVRDYLGSLGLNAEAELRFSHDR
ncbi:hypothetical protein ACFQ3B_24195 [Stackebrandtia endophytica]|uniref:hypothetical protein n=1 Tax=Stackebrandtia endophytica TaxID=1496996 RepID=UPI00114FE030|nr:hypothetical protein [Stackebrandtia endophytica]